MINTPDQLEAVLEGDTRVTLGANTIKALRSEQILALVEAQTRINRAFYGLQKLDAGARPQLEELSLALDEGSRIASALWWLAAGDDTDAQERGT